MCRCIKKPSTCLDWNWCRTLGHCVHGESLTHWLSSHPWSSPARHQTPCQSGLSLQAEDRRTFEFLCRKSDDNLACSSHCWLWYLLLTWPCGVFSAWRSTPWLWSQQSLLQSSSSHLWHPLQLDPAGVERWNLFVLLKMLFKKKAGWIMWSFGVFLLFVQTTNCYDFVLSSNIAPLWHT